MPVRDRLFRVAVRDLDDGRAELTVTATGGGRPASELRGVLAPGDVGVLARVLGAELKSLAAWYGIAPKTRFSEMVEEARRLHRNAYAPWNSEEEEELVARFRSGAKIPALAIEFGRSAGAVQARLEQLGEVDPNRGDSIGRLG